MVGVFGRSWWGDATIEELYGLGLSTILFLTFLRYKETVCDKGHFQIGLVDDPLGKGLTGVDACG